MSKQTKQLLVQQAKGLMDCYVHIGSELYWSCTKEAFVEEQYLDVLCRSIVANTNLAFACETGLKLLIHAEKLVSIQNTHDLNKLFLSLSDQSQIAIRALTIKGYNERISNQPNIIESDFTEMLDKNKKAFEDSRYWHELIPGKTKSMGNLFVLSFAEAISFFVNIYPFKDKEVYIIPEKTSE